MRILAHRGGAAHAPENTMAAFELACQMKADGIETDIRTTRDGVAVLIHDATVDRTTDGSGNIIDLTWEQARQLNASAKFGDGTYPATRIPRLDEMVPRFARQMPLTLEVKCERAIDLLADLLHEHDLTDEPTLEITCFEVEYLDPLRKALPDLPLTWLLRTAIDDAVLQQAVSSGVQRVGPKATLLEAKDVQRAGEFGLLVRPWGIKTVELMHHAAACGVYGITLDCLDWREQLQRV